jgi:hypothetical protein
MIQKSRQSALLAAPILGKDGEFHADTHYSFNNRGVGKLIKACIHIIINNEDLFNRKIKSEFSEYFGVLVSKYIEKSDLGLELALSSNDKLRIRCIQMYLDNKTHGITWPPDLSNYGEDKFFVYKDSYEYHGNIKNTPLPVIRLRRRVRRTHTERYVGVGYKDKGSSKDSSNDGSPDWKTSSRELNLSKERTEMILKNLKFKDLMIRKTLELSRDESRNLRKVELVKIETHDGLLQGWRIDRNTTIARNFVSNLNENDLSQLLVELNSKLTNGEVFLLEN